MKKVTASFHVQEHGTGKPLSGVQVELVGKDSGTTDKSGNVRLSVEGGVACDLKVRDTQTPGRFRPTYSKKEVPAEYRYNDYYMSLSPAEQGSVPHDPLPDRSWGLSFSEGSSTVRIQLRRVLQDAGTISGVPNGTTTIVKPTAETELLDKDKNVIDWTTASLRFGMFDHAWYQDPTVDNNGVRSDHLRNGLLEEENYVGSDSRHFHLRVRDKNPPAVKWVKGKRTIEVHWITTYPGGKTMDNNNGHPAITLVEEQPGEFVSKGLMLISQKADQARSTHCGIDGLHPAGGQEHRAFGETDHRTRLASLFGHSKVVYPGSDCPAQLTQVWSAADRYNLPIQIFVYRDKSHPDGACSEHEVFGGALHKMREIYAPLGIYPSTATHPVAESMLAKSDPRIKKVSGGLRDFYYLVDAAYSSSSFNVSLVSWNGAHEFVNAFERTGDTIRLYFVRDIERAHGLSWADVDNGSARHSGASLCKPDGNPSMAIAAHEIGHLLTNKSYKYGIVADQRLKFLHEFGGHYSRPKEPPITYLPNYHNLMGGNMFRLWDHTIEEAPNPGEAGLSNKSFNQCVDMRSSPFLRR